MTAVREGRRTSQAEDENLWSIIIDKQKWGRSKMTVEMAAACMNVEQKINNASEYHATALLEDAMKKYGTDSSKTGDNP